MRMVPALALITLGISGVAVGTASAGTASVPHRTHGAQPPPVDHQLCYNASGTHFSIPSGVRLINQFSPNGFIPVISSTLTVHCNPVQKTLPSGQVFPITNPNAHLACFPIAVPSPQPTPTVVVTNQFGSATLVPAQPNLLCAPSWKSLTGPPGKTPTTPPGLNHFTCYPVSVKSGAYKPPVVLLQDEFAHASVSAQVSPIPAELCLPTEKILPTGQVFPIINPSQHLLCFPVSPTPIVSQVWDENQFGTSPVSIKATKWLCPPSTKIVVGPGRIHVGP
ncbi:MAG TPA: hypothetical protein VKU39_02360 [Streptosporangiaceae bacterium]|nr:hypothetical protein [Streptosporangiaceae bacterium]